MDPIAIFHQWFDTLTELASKINDLTHRQQVLTVTEVDDTFAFHGASPKTSLGMPLAVLARGARASDDNILKLTKHKLILLAYPAARSVVRHMPVPARAREFLEGVVRNQIDRLSPWPAGQFLYGYRIAGPEVAGQAMLDVEVVIAARQDVENLRSRFAESGLFADRVSVARDGAEPVLLWSRVAAKTKDDLRRVRFVLGGSLAAFAAICVAACVWALVSASTLQAEEEETLEQTRSLQKHATGAGSSQALAGLPQPRRAWLAKETSVSMSILLEALSRAIPDGTYLTELKFEAGKIHLTGLADDAPPLIGILERSGHLSDVHFAAPTTRGPDGRLSRFSIEARVEPRLDLKEE